MPNAAAAEDLAAAFADVQTIRQGKAPLRRPRIYEPLPGDYVVGRVEASNAEGYRVKLMGAAVPGMLGAIAFDGATKRTRPHLNVDDLVYCRVLRVPRGGEAELTCCAAPKGPRREWRTKGGTFGPLSSAEALVAVVPPPFAEALLARDAPVLHALAAHLPFEVAIGLNGRVWCRAATLGDAIVVVNVLENAAHLDGAASVVPMCAQVLGAMRAKMASQGGYAQAARGGDDAHMADEWLVQEPRRSGG